MDQPPAIIIQEDFGGLIGDYLNRVIEIRKSGAQVRIMGECDSACTLYLSLPDVCVGPHAKLGFHKASNEAGTAVLWSYYSDKLREWITSEGGLTSNLKWLFGSKLRQIVKECE